MIDLLFTGIIYLCGYRMAPKRTTRGKTDCQTHALPNHSSTSQADATSRRRGVMPIQTGSITSQPQCSLFSHAAKALAQGEKRSPTCGITGDRSQESQCSGHRRLR
jgi:hypothetical protein